MQSPAQRQGQKNRESRRLGKGNDRNESQVQSPGSESKTWEADNKRAEELDAHKQTLSNQVT